MSRRVVVRLRYPSPSAQRRGAELWKARLGLASVVVLTVCSIVIMYRLAGIGVQAGLALFQSTSGLLRDVGVARPAQVPLPPIVAAATAVPTPAVLPTAAALPTLVPTTAASPALQMPATPTLAPRQRPTATTVPGGAMREHIVVRGDTLFSLARRYGSSVEAIVAANNLRDRNATLRIGQRLIVP